MKHINGKVVVITGASQGIGKAIAFYLAAKGAKVALIARNKDRLDEVTSDIETKGGVARGYVCDVKDSDGLKNTLDTIASELGPVKILINNAGVGTFKPMNETGFNEAVDPVLLPYLSSIAASHHVLPKMIEMGEGHIVNLTSPSGYIPIPNMVPYTSSRHAIVGFSLALHEEVKSKGIGVSLVCPGEVNTDYFKSNDADMDWFPKISKLLPRVEPEEVAEVVYQAIKKDQREVIFPGLVNSMVRIYQTFPNLTMSFLKSTGLFSPIKAS